MKFTDSKCKIKGCVNPAYMKDLCAYHRRQKAAREQGKINGCNQHSDQRLENFMRHERQVNRWWV